MKFRNKKSVCLVKTYYPFMAFKTGFWGFDTKFRIGLETGNNKEGAALFLIMSMFVDELLTKSNQPIIAFRRALKRLKSIDKTFQNTECISKDSKQQST